VTVGVFCSLGSLAAENAEKSRRQVIIAGETAAILAGVGQ
jgi:hypothetical protein